MCTCIEEKYVWFVNLKGLTNSFYLCFVSLENLELTEASNSEVFHLWGLNLLHRYNRFVVFFNPVDETVES